MSRPPRRSVKPPKPTTVMAMAMAQNEPGLYMAFCCPRLNLELARRLLQNLYPSPIPTAPAPDDLSSPHLFHCMAPWNLHRSRSRPLRERVLHSSCALARVLLAMEFTPCYRRVAAAKLPSQRTVPKARPSFEQAKTGQLVGPGTKECLSGKQRTSYVSVSFGHGLSSHVPPL